MNENPQATILSQTLLKADGFQKVHGLQIEHQRFDGGSLLVNREVVERGDSVFILAYDPAQQMVMLGREMRAGILYRGEYPFTYALPAGKIDEGEDALTTACREAREEMALELRDPRIVLDRLYLSEGGSSERATLVFATVSAPRHNAVLGVVQEHENILRRSVPVTEFFAMANTRRMVSAMANMGALWLRLHVAGKEPRP